MSKYLKSTQHLVFGVAFCAWSLYAGEYLLALLCGLVVIIMGLLALLADRP